MISNEVLLRGRNERTELFDELERLKDDVGGAVGPRFLEAIGEPLTVGQPLEPVVGDGAPAHVSADILKPVAITGIHRHVGVEVEAVQLGATPRANHLPMKTNSGVKAGEGVGAPGLNEDINISWASRR